MLKKFFKRYDSNRDGRINIDELTMMMQVAPQRNASMRCPPVE